MHRAAAKSWWVCWLHHNDCFSMCHQSDVSLAKRWLRQLKSVDVWTLRQQYDIAITLDPQMLRTLEKSIVSTMVRRWILKQPNLHRSVIPTTSSESLATVMYKIHDGFEVGFPAGLNPGTKKFPTQFQPLLLHCSSTFKFNHGSNFHLAHLSHNCLSLWPCYCYACRLEPVH